MAKWENILFQGKIGEKVKSEYRKLLSVKKTEEEAEQILVDYFKEQLSPGSPGEGLFWMALALREWQLGRLSARAKEKVLEWTKFPWEDAFAGVVHSLVETLNSPMPPKKKIRLPSYVSHCPWPVGSLLAYRIISSDDPYVTQSPFYKKYVLLRIIKINRYPVTKLAPEAGWNEGMLVGLYHWIGDSIPDPQIVGSLQFTPVCITEPSLPPWIFSQIQMLSQLPDTDEHKAQVIKATTRKRVETCCHLDWQCARGINPKEVFTFLGCDPTFENEVIPFFKTNITDYSLCHSMPFDAMLVNRFMQLTQEQKSED